MRTTLSLAALALPFLASAAPPSNFSLEFQLVQCSNAANPSKDPFAVNGTERSWSHIAMFSPNTPQQWHYALPSPGTPYVRYEGNPRMAYFWSEQPNPRGFLRTEIPAEAIGYQTDVAAGKVVFEGVDYPCQVKWGGPLWGGYCREDYPYCAGYTMCHERFFCKSQEAWNPPLKKNEDVHCTERPNQVPRCRPNWVSTG